jgi:hypothetical protein
MYYDKLKLASLKSAIKNAYPFTRVCVKYLATIVGKMNLLIIIGPVSQ